jgi:hypothetical protein
LLYSELEKIAYAVVMATRKLRHCFKAHRVTMLINPSMICSSTRRLHPE